MSPRRYGSGWTIIFAAIYWGLHLVFYGPNGHVGPATADRATHSHSPEYPHGPQAAGGIGAPPNRDTGTSP